MPHTWVKYILIEWARKTYISLPWTTDFRTQFASQQSFIYFAELKEAGAKLMVKTQINSEPAVL